MGQAKNRQVEIEALKLSGDTYDSHINRSNERVKRNGEVFTPPALVREILANLPEDYFKDPSKTFLDPACGDGAFLIEVIAKKMSNGSNCLQALATTFGTDIMFSNVVATRNRLVTYIMNNVVVANFGVKTREECDAAKVEIKLQEDRCDAANITPQLVAYPGNMQDFKDLLLMKVTHQIKQADALKADFGKLFAR